MASGFASDVLLWFATYAMHSTLFLGAVWALDAAWRRASPALLGMLWRTAMVAAIATASLQLSGLVQPVAGRMQMPVEFSQPAFAGRSAEALAPVVTKIPAMTETVDAAAPADTQAAETPAAQEIAFSSADWWSGVVAAGELVALDWRSGVVVAWAVIAFVLAVRGVLAWAAAHRELAGREPVAEGPLSERIRRLAREVGLRRTPRVSLSSRIAGPFTLPSGEICIPVWACEKLPQHQLDAMLAHEMAHTLHRDSLWLTIGMAVDTFFFFQPLNGLARKRIGHLAELCADDRAATRAGDGRPLAECLSEFAGAAHGRKVPAFVAAMARPKSALVQRVERLLNGRYTNGAIPMRSKLLAGACAVGLAVLVPGFAASEAPAPVPVPAPAPAPAPQESMNFHSSNGNVSLSVSTRRADYTLKVEGRGKIKLAPDGSGMEQLSNGGYLDLTYNRGGQSRRVRFSGEGGAVKRQFWIGGKGEAWGAEADRFVKDVMPIVFRETGINAEERIAWFLKTRGEDALLSEIALIDSDTVQRIYAGSYAETGRLADQRLAQLLEIVRKQMESDTETRITLSQIYETQEPMGPRLAGLLRTTSSIDSDTETRLVLITVREAALDTDEAMGAYLDATASIQSDTEMRLTLSEVVSASGIADTRIQQAIALAGDRVESDTELRLVLSEAARRVGASDALAAAYLKAVRAIGSSTERRLTLLALAEDAKLSAGSWRTLLDTAREIDSSTEKRLVLTGVADKLPRQPDIVSAYRAAVDTIGSETERRLAGQALE